MSKYQNYGNVNMNGKPEKMLACGCCVAQNKKRFPSKEDQKKIFETLERGPRK